MGSRVLVDTDYLIDYVRGRVELPEGRWFISEITLYEFTRGTRDPAEAKKLLEEEFTVIYHDNEIIERAAEIWRRLRSAGLPVDDRDLLVAAVAIVKKLPLLTRNTKHFERFKPFGLELHPSAQPPEVGRVE